MIQAIRDNAPVGLITLDLKGRVESLNHYAERILGLTETEVLGASSALLLADTDANDVIQDFAAYVKTGKSDLVGQGVKELLASAKTAQNFQSTLHWKRWSTLTNACSSAVLSIQLNKS